METSITVSGREIAIKRVMMRLRDLQFYTENPRVYTIVHNDGDDEPDQEKIQSALQSMDHVKQLIQAIRQNGGLTDPLLVRGSDNSVLEGNSRLAAYHFLAQKNATKWGMVKCDVIVDDISDNDVTTLLASYHIIGRKSWEPFEQAGMFWRWSKEGVDPKDIAQRVEGMGISSKAVLHWIEVYQFMIDHKDIKPARWSHYDELLKSRYIKNADVENPQFVEVVAKRIKSGNIRRAIDVREKVGKIAKAGGRAIKGIIAGKTVDSCYELAKEAGATNVTFNKIRKFKEVIGAPETLNELIDMDDAIRGDCKYDLQHIKTSIERIIKRLK